MSQWTSNNILSLYKNKSKFLRTYSKTDIIAYYPLNTHDLLFKQRIEPIITTLT